MIPYVVVLVVLSTVCHVPFYVQTALVVLQVVTVFGYVVVKLAYFRVFQFLTFCLCLWGSFAMFPKVVC
jgi:hypothetical protein